MTADFTTALETGLYTTLNVSAVTNLATGGVWNKLAPQGTVMPYLVFQWQGGGDENMTPKRSGNLAYTVKAIATDEDNAKAISAAADALLHLQTLTVSGWVNFWTAREGLVNYMEIDPTGPPIFHIGGVYRIRIAV